ncbi:hypothetical protein Tco_0571749 [Tanacetum coccineum]
MPISAGITALVPYVRLNGVSPLLVLGVVLWGQTLFRYLACCGPMHQSSDPKYDCRVIQVLVASPIIALTSVISIDLSLNSSISTPFVSPSHCTAASFLKESAFLFSSLGIIEYSAPSGSIRMRPSLDPCSLDAPSVYNFHMSASALRFSGALVSVSSCSSILSPYAKMSFGPSVFACVGLSSAIVSARKLARTCAFIALLKAYLMPSAIGFFIAWNASSAYIIQWKSFLFVHFLSVSRHGRALSAALKRNLFKAASFQLSRCICFRLLGEGMFSTTFVFSGFALIPSEVTLYPKNLPSSILKEHFFEVSIYFLDEMGDGCMMSSGSLVLSVCPRLPSLSLLVAPSESDACILRGMVLPSMASPCASYILRHSWRVSLLVVIVAIPLAVGNFIIEWIVEATAPKLLRPVRPNMTL